MFEEGHAQNISYRDLSAKDWFYPAMVKMIGAGYIRGYADGSLKPNSYVTRAEAVAIINRMCGLSGSGGGNRTFDDVSPEHWAYADIMAASN